MSKILRKAVPSPELGSWAGSFSQFPAGQSKTTSRGARVGVRGRSRPRRRGPGLGACKCPQIEFGPPQWSNSEVPEVGRGSRRELPKSVPRTVVLIRPLCSITRPSATAIFIRGNGAHRSIFLSWLVSSVSGSANTDKRVHRVVAPEL